MKVTQAILALTCAALISCAHQPGKDPLQNTKKLVKEGHATLYNNGAFEIPMTTIHIIPPGNCIACKMLLATSARPAGKVTSFTRRAISCASLAYFEI